MVLAFLAAVRVLLLSQGGQFFRGGDEPGQSLVWVIFVLHLFLFLGFSSGAYGLLRLHSWGRIVFLWSITIWSGYRLITLFVLLFSANQNHTAWTLILTGLDGVSCLLPLWYLNLTHIKTMFLSSSLENFAIEGTTTNDNID
jgi:hypothetical protein